MMQEHEMQAEARGFHAELLEVWHKLGHCQRLSLARCLDLIRERERKVARLFNEVQQ